MKNFFPKLTLAGIIFLVTSQVAFGGFSLTPATPSDRQFTFQIAAGQEKQSAVIVKNISDQPLTLLLYGADGTQSNQGTFALTTLSSEQRHIGKWVTFNQKNVKLDPHEEKEVGFTVKVPAGATPGVYSGGIAAETTANPATPATEPKQAATAAGAKTGKTGTQEVKAATQETAKPAQNQNNSINISARIVVKIFVTVPGQKVHKYEWTDFSYAASDNGSPGSFNLHYRNTGNTIVAVDQEIQVSGFPARSDTIKLAPATLLQGSDVQIPVKWDNEPFFGFYTAKASLVFSEYDVTSNTKINPQTETREITVFIPLKTDTPAGKITLVLLAVLLGLIVALVVIIIRRVLLRRRCNPYVVKEGDSITSIAESCKINWKKLARLNKLKAPYTIKPGQKLMAPQPNQPNPRKK